MAGTIALRPRFERWQQTHEQTNEQLARYLGVTIDMLAKLADESVQDDGSGSGLKGMGERWDQGDSDTPDQYQLDQLAGRYGADRKRLFDLVAFNEMHDDRRGNG